MKCLIKFSSLALVAALLISCSDDGGSEVPKSIFTVIGDVPYGATQRAALETNITAHNNQAESMFVVHVGDIKAGATACDEAVYTDVSGLLNDFSITTFSILGDNEYNDCADPAQARGYWDDHFLNMHENWSFGPTVTKQATREENFSWVQNDVLYIGVNVVGSSVHDAAEWATRLQDDADWLTAKFNEHGDDVYAAVVFGHANIADFGPVKFEPFTNPMRAAAASFEKPVLYIHGDGHSWIDNKPWPEQNLRRVQIDGGSKFVEVTVDPSNAEAFSFVKEMVF